MQPYFVHFETLTKGSQEQQFVLGRNFQFVVTTGNEFAASPTRAPKTGVCGQICAAHGANLAGERVAPAAGGQVT